MDKYETIIGELMKAIIPIAQCRYKMYFSENIYYQIPSLSYRIDSHADQQIYEIVHQCIESYQGNLKWTEYESFFGRKNVNHIIAPTYVYEMQKEYYITGRLVSQIDYLGEVTYRKVCELAIKDIPSLFEHLSEILPVVLANKIDV